MKIYLVAGTGSDRNEVLSAYDVEHRLVSFEELRKGEYDMKRYIETGECTKNGRKQTRRSFKRRGTRAGKK